MNLSPWDAITTPTRDLTAKREKSKEKPETFRKPEEYLRPQNKSGSSTISLATTTTKLVLQPP
jgi:hypothetical protein